MLSQILLTGFAFVAVSSASQARPVTSEWNADHQIAGITFHNLEEFYHKERVAIGDHRRRGDVDFDLESILSGRTIQSTVPADWILRTNNFRSTEEICIAAGKDRCLQKFRRLFHGVVVHATLPQITAILSPFAIAVTDAEPSLEVHAVDVQQDATWGLDRLDQAELPLDNSFEYPSQSGNGVKVFVIDTGVRCTHDEFSGRCISGWSAYNGGACLQGSACAYDVHGHGTHCAGTVAGSTYGVAKSATIVAVKVLSDSGFGDTLGVISGMEWVLDQKVADTSGTPMVASMSLGGVFSQALNDAVMAMKNGGVAVAVAAGNEYEDACLSSPASAPDAITVGSTTSSDQRSWFSNFGSCVDIFAPGSSITSAGINGDSSTKVKSGTSMACPHVAGVLAQILGSEPSLTPSQAEDLLKENALANVVSDSRTTPNLLLHNRIATNSTCFTRDSTMDELCKSGFWDESSLYDIRSWQVRDGADPNTKVSKWGDDAQFCRRKEHANHFDDWKESRDAGLFGNRKIDGHGRSPQIRGIRQCDTECVYDISNSAQKYFIFGDCTKGAGCGCWRFKSTGGCEVGDNAGFQDRAVKRFNNLC